MPTRLHFEFYGETQVDRTLERFEAAADMRPAWEALADRFAFVERRQFATEGAYASGGWAPLSPAYAAWKARHYPGQPILRRTDDLFESLTVRPFDEHGGIEVIEPSHMMLGSAVRYGRFHQHGTRRMPRRRPVELTEAERREWVRIVQRYLVTGVAPTIGPRGGIRG